MPAIMAVYAAEVITAALVFSAVVEVITIAAVAYSVYMMATMKTPANQSDAANRLHTVRSSVQPHRVIYGTVKTGGVLVYAQSHGLNNKFITLVVAFAAHEVAAITDVYLNDRPDSDPFFTANIEAVAEYGYSDEAGNYTVVVPGTPASTYSWITVSKYTGTATQEADPLLLGLPDGIWTVNHRLQGRAYAVVTLENFDFLFPNGLPAITAIIQGNNQIYDPATDTTGYSNNWALCVRDYLTKPYGLNAPASDINETVAITARNICAETVALSAGGTEPRYAINGSFTVDKTPTAVMNELLASAYGAITWTQGQYRILPAAYYAPDVTFHGMNPDVVGLTESDLRGPIKVRPSVSMKDKFNQVKGTYISPETWQQVDFPLVKNALYLAEDGGFEQTRDIQLNYITSAATAQRVAKIVLEKGRQGISVDFPAKWSAFPLAVGDTVPITIAQLGWSGKIFSVRDWKMNPEGGVDLQLQEDAAGCYEWNSGEETTVDLAPDTILPNPNYVPLPTGLTVGEELYIANTTSAVKCRAILSWADMGASQYEANYLPPNNSIWGPLPMTRNTVMLIDDVIPGAYQFRVRAMNAWGIWGEWATVSATILGKMAPPHAVSGFAATLTRGQMLISWNPNTDLDIAGYEIQTGTVWDASGNSTLTANYAGTSYGWTPTSSGTIYLLIKAIDTSGNYSTTAAVLTHTVTAPYPVTNLQRQVIDNIVQLAWEAATGISSFPVDYYELWRGNDFASATLIGRKYGTFDILSESVSGTYKYWVRAVDVAGLMSSAVGIYAVVNQPPDYVLISDQTITLSSCTLTNGLYVDGDILLPINTTITWEDHFQTNPDTTLEPWSTPQDQIDDGYPYYIQPGPSTALIEKIIDYGATIPASIVTMGVTREAISGTVVFTPEILWSLDGSSYTSLGNVYSTVASAFRYIKYRLAATTADGGVAAVQIINVKLDVKQRNFVTNSITVSDTSSDGTAVTFASLGIAPVDIVGIVAEAPFTNNATNDPIKCMVNFVDAANPTSFKVLAWNKAGTRVAVSGVTVTIRYI